MKMKITFLLDESGSMETIKDDTIGGFNQYLGTVQGLDAEVSFTFLKFDSNKVEKVCVGKPVAEVPQLTNETYQPGASTPLIDAAMEAILATEKVVVADDKVIVVIQTDGHENASVTYRHNDLAAKIKELTAAGWEFIFIGAGIDAYDQASLYGIQKTNTMSYGTRKSAQAFDSLASNTAAYVASSGASGMSFTNAQRTASGDQFAGGNGDPAQPTPQPEPPQPPRPPQPPVTPPPAAKPLVEPIDLSA